MSQEIPREIGADASRLPSAAEMGAPGPSAIEQIGRVLDLIAQNAAQILEEVDQAAERPIEALATVGGIASDGARDVKAEGDKARRDVGAHKASDDLRDRVVEFADSVSGISDRSASDISEQVSQSVVAAQNFDLVRQRIQTLRQIAEYAASTLARDPADAAAVEDQYAFDANVLQRFYVAETQRALHAAIFGAAPSSADSAQDAPIELF